MQKLRGFSACASLLVVSTLAQAQESAQKARFSLSLPVFKAKEIKETTKSSTGKQHKLTQKIQTAPTGSSASFTAGLGDYSATFYLLDPDNQSVTLGYSLTDKIDLGFDLGYNHNRDSSTHIGVDKHLIGVAISYTFPIGHGFLSSTGSTYDLTIAEKREENNGERSKTKSTESYIDFGTYLIHKLADNVSWSGGPFISKTVRNEEKGPTVTTIETGVTVAKLSYSW